MNQLYIAEVQNVCPADPKGSATSFQMICGYISAAITLELT